MAINITDGFYLGRATPIDTRMVAKNSSVRTSIKYKYDGLRVFQTDTRESWVWNASSSSWQLETSGISGSTGSIDYLSKWSSSSSLTSSNIYIDPSNGNISIGGTGSTTRLQITGGSNQPLNVYNDSTMGAGIAYNWKYDGGDSIHSLIPGSLKMHIDTDNNSYVMSVRNPGDLSNRFNNIFELNKTTEGQKWNILKSPGAGNFINGSVVFDKQSFDIGFPVITYKKPQHVYIDGSLRTNSAKYESVTWVSFDGSFISYQYGINRVNSNTTSTTTKRTSTYVLRGNDENIIIESTTKATMYVSLGDLGSNTDEIGRIVNISYQNSNNPSSETVIQSTNDIVSSEGITGDIILFPGESVSFISFVRNKSLKWKVKHRHVNLGDVDGGGPDEYYHLTQVQHTTLTGGTTSNADAYHTHDAKYTFEPGVTMSMSVTASTRLYFIDPSSDITLTLPPPAAYGGESFIFKRIDSSSNLVTITASTGLIENVPSINLPYPQSYTLVSNGVGWYII